MEIMKKMDNLFELICGEKVILERVYVEMNFSDGKKIHPRLSQKSTEKNKTILDFDCGDELISFRLIAEEDDNVLFLKAEAECSLNFLDPPRKFAGENGVIIYAGGLGKVNKVLAHYPANPFWTRPYVGESTIEIPPKSISLMVQNGDDISYYLPVPTNTCKTEISGINKGITIALSSYCSGYNRISGYFMVVSNGTDPYEAVDKLFKVARQKNIIQVPLRCERSYPEQFNYFGWCSWDAFYHNISDAGITHKVEEFCQKNIPLKWMIIDDGWSCVKDWKLTSIKEDRSKFPYGLKEFIFSMKQNYGVQFVGVWHSFMGYWLGIEKNSEIYDDLKDYLFETKTGSVIPDCTSAKGEKFWRTWHSYLKEQGVDFLKIDTQGSLKGQICDELSVIEAASKMHEGIENSVKDYFEGNVINCMGITQENIFNRAVTGISRNSDDFFPKKENGFDEHLMQNAYNSVFHNQLYYCDWDMWWSRHESARKSSILRAISGGPVYVSDKVGETDPEMILPLIEYNGRILRCDQSARPTVDCLFTNCQKGNRCVKLFNTVGENGVMAIFNITESKKSATADVRISDIKGIDYTLDYVCYSYKEKKYFYFEKHTVLSITCAYSEAEILNFYPVKDGKVMLGDLTKYVSSASAIKEEMDVKKLFFG